MKRIILIKYGELSTKKGNKNFFINTLYENVKNKLKQFDVSIFKDRSRMYIEFHDSDLEEIKIKLDCVFGIHMYHIAYIVDTSIESIKKLLVELIRDLSFKTFKVETKRSDKSFSIHSQDMNHILGSVVLKNKVGVSVDVHNPELFIKLEIRETYSYVYFNAYRGVGGYPIGTQPKGLLMLSGGIDSPVSGYLAMKRGIPIDCVYFEAIPHTSLDARNKVIELSKKLAKYSNKVQLHIINFTQIQEEIYKNCHSNYCITIMRRMMYRIMEKMANKYHGFAIINGESVGQVASQTLTSMRVINEVTCMPILRPVACFDKLEIIDLAKKIGTYDISILPYEDCCTVFVPKHPVINPSLEQAKKEEKKFDFMSMIDKALDEVVTIEIFDDQQQFLELL